MATAGDNPGQGNPPATPPGQGKRPLDRSKSTFVPPGHIVRIAAKSGGRFTVQRLTQLLNGNQNAEPAISSTSEPGQEALRRIGCRV
jgi:hypothetical protein